MSIQAVNIPVFLLFRDLRKLTETVSSTDNETYFAKRKQTVYSTIGRGGRVVRCRIAMPEVVSSNPGRGKNKFTTVMGSDGKL